MVVAVPLPDERDKQAWRAEIRARRARLPELVRTTEAAALAAAAADLGPAEWVCAYLPMRAEPGSPAMPEALRASGSRVLLPVTGAPGPLRWGEFTGAGSLRPGRYGLLEPVGPVLPPEAVARAEVLLIPALAVDRRGVRLGQGAGYYDRTLGMADPTARRTVVVRDDEVVERLPEEPHDIRMTWVLTPGGGLRRLDVTAP
ncbi:5-formyltetrahydrofolate cyclo-ligase [Nocardia zapadnayensis]|uniref:5-formyltetrahydrofolate cyclo-ligase n=1 Tax=Nocardia rhamnosiphila TaxID=426716 RepID=UPI002247D50B|nr:5-formyltetrahydrofolate cyclo-ligase [Nocardia zapadnayensis]MCX0271009.1 5-formyltetrahydrofolate cyclo-ligase [Nocardia zapadnayensis]